MLLTFKHGTKVRNKLVKRNYEFKHFHESMSTNINRIITFFYS